VQTQAKPFSIYVISSISHACSVTCVRFHWRCTSTAIKLFQMVHQYHNQTIPDGALVPQSNYSRWCTNTAIKLFQMVCQYRNQTIPDGSLVSQRDPNTCNRTMGDMTCHWRQYGPPHWRTALAMEVLSNGALARGDLWCGERRETDQHNSRTITPIHPVLRLQ
jgi:hypothetical protein